MSDPSRIGSARNRAAGVKRGLAVGAIASFGLALALARASHPARSSSSPSGGSGGLAPASSLVQQEEQGGDDGFQGGGGSIAPAAGPPQASTQTS